MHGAKCTVRANRGCALCKRIWAFLQLHARQCRKGRDCRVPKCNELKEHHRRMQYRQQAMDMRRRNAATDRARGVTAAGAAARHTVAVAGAGAGPHMKGKGRSAAAAGAGVGAGAGAGASVAAPMRSTSASSGASREQARQQYEAKHRAFVKRYLQKQKQAAAARGETLTQEKMKAMVQQAMAEFKQRIERARRAVAERNASLTASLRGPAGAAQALATRQQQLARLTPEQLAQLRQQHAQRKAAAAAQAAAAANGSGKGAGTGHLTAQQLQAMRMQAASRGASAGSGGGVAPGQSSGRPNITAAQLLASQRFKNLPPARQEEIRRTLQQRAAQNEQRRRAAAQAAAAAGVHPGGMPGSLGMAVPGVVTTSGPGPAAMATTMASGGMGHSAPMHSSMGVMMSGVPTSSVATVAQMSAGVPTSAGMQPQVWQQQQQVGLSQPMQQVMMQPVSQPVSSMQPLGVPITAAQYLATSQQQQQTMTDPSTVISTNLKPSV